MLAQSSCRLLPRSIYRVYSNHSAILPYNPQQYQSTCTTDISHIKQIGIIGAGQMGTGIAYVSAVTGKYNVTILDNNQIQLNKSIEFIKSLLKKDISKGKLDSNTNIDDIISRIHTTTSYDTLSTNHQYIIEAASESLSIKQNIFHTLAQCTSNDTILATNTSSISITKIAASTITSSNPDRPSTVIGMHFMNPVPVMKLVECISGLQTSKSTLDITLALGSQLGKTMTHSADIPGFIANRLLMPYINEAIYTLQENISSRDDIDTTMKLGCSSMYTGDYIINIGITI